MSESSLDPHEIMNALETRVALWRAFSVVLVLLLSAAVTIAFVALEHLKVGHVATGATLDQLSMETEYCTWARKELTFLQADVEDMHARMTQTPDPTVDLTPEQYLDYIDGAWTCAEYDYCQGSDDLEWLLHDICALGWHEANREWSRWQTEAEQCYCKLDHAGLESRFPTQPHDWGCYW